MEVRIEFKREVNVVGEYEYPLPPEGTYDLNFCEEHDKCDECEKK